MSQEAREVGEPSGCTRRLGSPKSRLILAGSFTWNDRSFL
jgi:hypothetical protein